MNTFSDLIPRANNNNKIALFPKLIVNCHLPASDGQALDVYFNAVFKTTLSHLRNKRIANEYIEFKSREEIRKTNAAASGMMPYELYQLIVPENTLPLHCRMTKDWSMLLRRQ